MTYRELRLLLLKAGWEFVCENGDHQLWKKGDVEPLIIAGDDSDELTKGLMNYFLKKIGVR